VRGLPQDRERGSGVAALLGHADAQRLVDDRAGLQRIPQVLGGLGLSGDAQGQRQGTGRPAGEGQQLLAGAASQGSGSGEYRFSAPARRVHGQAGQLGQELLQRGGGQQQALQLSHSNRIASARSIPAHVSHPLRTHLESPRRVIRPFAPNVETRRGVVSG
jgi:hypothetical protein